MLAGRGGRCMHRAPLALGLGPFGLAQARRSTPSAGAAAGACGPPGGARPARAAREARVTLTLNLTLAATARRRSVPFLLQAVRQGLQDLGARDLPAARAALAAGAQRVEARSSSAQVPPARCLITLHGLHFRHARAVRVAACCTSAQAPHGGCLVGCRAVRSDASLAVALSGNVRDVHAELHVVAQCCCPTEKACHAGLRSSHVYLNYMST